MFNVCCLFHVVVSFCLFYVGFLFLSELHCSTVLLPLSLSLLRDDLSCPLQEEVVEHLPVQGKTGGK